MPENRLEHSLDDLFAGLPLPKPEAGEGAPPPLVEPDEEVVVGKPERLTPTEKRQPDLQDWREQFVRSVLRLMAVLGFLALLAGSYWAYNIGKMWAVALYTITYLILLLVAFLPGVNYRVQSVTILALLYGMGIVDFIASGEGGEGRVFLLAIAPLAVVLFGRRAGLATLIWDILTMALFGWLYATGRLFIPPERTVSTNPVAWFSNTVVLVMLGALLVSALGNLIPHLSSSLARSRRLADELEIRRVELETERARLEARTRSLQEANYAIQRRAIQLEASAEVGRAIASIFDMGELLHRAVELVRDRFGFYYAAVFLLDEGGEWLVLQEATGDIGARLKAEDHRLPVDETSMVGRTASHLQASIVLDVEGEAGRFEHPPLPLTRSQVTLPLVMHGRLLGVLDVQSDEPAAFDSDDVRMLQSMADQLSVAIENARRFSEEAALLEATSPIYRASRRLTTVVTAEDVLDTITSILQETRIDGYMVGFYEPPGSNAPETIHLARAWKRGRRSPVEPGTRMDVAGDPEQALLHRERWTAAEVGELPALPRLVEQVEGQAAANFPFRAGERTDGFLLVYRLKPGPFSETDLRLYETLADQAASALERAWLLQATRQRMEEEAALRAIGDRVARAMDVGSVLRGAAEELSQALRAEGAWVELRPGPALGNAAPTSEAE